MSNSIPDFAALRQEAIHLVQALSGNTWTDFNLHDPGVTILEAVCYAITDLAYRTDFPITDILAGPNGDIQAGDNAFFSRKAILSTNPVTVNDFRKAILDEMDQLQNIWLEPVSGGKTTECLQGLYKAVIQVRKEWAPRLNLDSGFITSLQNAVRACFVSKRNICEDITQVVVLKPASLKINADIVTDGERLPEVILSDIYLALEAAINPPVPFLSEETLTAGGMRVEAVYSGPLLKGGFIPDEFLSSRKPDPDPAELIKAIGAVEGVTYVRSLVVHLQDISSGPSGGGTDMDYFAYFEDDPAQSRIRLFRDKYELPIRDNIFRDYRQMKGETAKRNTVQAPPGSPELAEDLKGNYRNLSEYHSIQRLFPALYNLLEDSFPEDTSVAYKAQVKQLKAYLLFFEQVLANYLAQLAHVRELFTPEVSWPSIGTYRYQPLNTVPGILRLVEKGAYESTLEKAAETDEQYKTRKHRLLDHLLARFNEVLSDYPVTLFDALYGSGVPHSRTDDSLLWKSRILKNLAVMTRDRNKGFDYLGTHSALASGLGRKIADLLFMQGDQVTELTAVFRRHGLSFREESGPHSADKPGGPDGPDAATGPNAPDHPDAATGPNAPDEPHAASAQETAAQATSGDIAYVSHQLPICTEAEMEDILQHLSPESSEPEPHPESPHERGTHAASVRFQGQKIDFFRHGIDLDNYKVGPDPRAGRKGFLVLFKRPDQQSWQIISRHTGGNGAIRSLQNSIQTLKEISIQSEGFHIMEHILLRPDMGSEAYGFRFYGTARDLLLQHSRWMTFDERQQVTGEILKSADAPSMAAFREWAGKCGIRLQQYESSGWMVDPATFKASWWDNAYPDYEKICRYLSLFTERKAAYYPRFNMVVKGPGGQIMDESFFNFSMTVLLPSWPARFQDRNFRTFAENMFRAHTPAHIRIRYQWLNITRMTIFEQLYWQWTTALKNPDQPKDKNGLSEKLVSFLLGNRSYDRL